MSRLLNDLDVFYDPSQQHAFSPAFDEGPPAVISSVQVGSGSTNTSAINAYTQGVELTQLRRHDAGFAKIWSGEPGHELLVAWYGDTGPSIVHPFADDEPTYLTDPAVLVSSNQTLFPILTYPLQPSSPDGILRYPTVHRVVGGTQVTYRTTQDVGPVTMNGVIEPLAVRLQPSFFGPVPVDVHAVRGSAGDGNADANGGTDQVLTVDFYGKSVISGGLPTWHFDALQALPPYADAGRPGNNQVIGQNLLTSSIGAISNPVVQRAITEAPLGAFVDARYTRNTLSSTAEGTDLLLALSAMSPSTNNYVSFEQRSATCGWVYDGSTAVGTDSLVFGGMTH